MERIVYDVQHKNITNRLLSCGKARVRLENGASRKYQWNWDAKNMQVVLRSDDTIVFQRRERRAGHVWTTFTTVWTRTQTGLYKRQTFAKRVTEQHVGAGLKHSDQYGRAVTTRFFEAKAA